MPSPIKPKIAEPAYVNDNGQATVRPIDSGNTPMSEMKGVNRIIGGEGMGGRESMGTMKRK